MATRIDQPAPARTKKLSCSLALLVLGVAGLYGDGEAQEAALRAFAVTEEGAFSAKDDPAATIWSRVPEELVQLNLAPPVHQSIALLQGQAAHADDPLPVGVSVITDGQRVYFRLRWKDGSLDDQRENDSFVDAAAVQIPFTAEDASPIMGSPDRPVSIWRWSADGNDVEALMAGSPGTLTKADSPGLRGKGTYRSSEDSAKNEWIVVISQDLNETGEGRASLRSRKSFPAAFAVWRGSERQRGGFKHVSYWIPVELPADK